MVVVKGFLSVFGAIWAWFSKLLSRKGQGDRNALPIKIKLTGDVKNFEVVIGEEEVSKNGTKPK